MARFWLTGEGFAGMCNAKQMWRFGQKRENKQTNKLHGSTLEDASAKI